MEDNIFFGNNIMLANTKKNRVTCKLCGNVQLTGKNIQLMDTGRCLKCESPLESAHPHQHEHTMSNWLNRAQASLKNGKYKEAVIAYSHAIREDGTNGLYYYKRAVAYNRIHDNLKALADLKRAAYLGFEAAQPAIKHLTKKMQQHRNRA